MGLFDVLRGLSAMWSAGDVSCVHGQRLEGAHMGLREGGQIGRSACLPRCNGHVAGSMRAERVQGERRHHGHCADAKKIQGERSLQAAGSNWVHKKSA